MQKFDEITFTAFLSRFPDFDKDIGVVVNSITVTFDSVKNQLVGAMQLMMDRHLYMFTVDVEVVHEDEHTAESCFLLTRYSNNNCVYFPQPTDAEINFLICPNSDTFNTRSVLRKKLKSPKNHGPKTTKSMTSNNRRSITTIFPPKTISSTGSFCPATTPSNLKTSFTHVDLIRQGKTKWVNQEIGDSSCSGRLPSTPRGHSSPSTMSPRSLKINPHASYIECEGLVFDSEQSFQVPTRLAESGISGIRIGASHDGKLIAVGANVSPLVILRTQPTLENARVYKDTGRVSSLHFAFNTKHLVSAFEQVLDDHVVVVLLFFLPRMHTHTRTGTSSALPFGGPLADYIDAPAYVCVFVRAGACLPMCIFVDQINSIDCIYFNLS